jgi:glycosyltransferase involved in cell wall biosynthesis
VRVGISLLTLAPGDLGGSETYARQLVKALASVGELEYSVFVPARAKDAAGGLPAIEVREPPGARRGPARIAAMALTTFRSRRIRARLETVDVVHYALTVPLPRTKAPTVVTLHDMQHRDLPDFFGPARRSFRRVAYDRATQAADAVVVTSEFVRDRALEVLELDPTRVHVVPHAINHTLYRPGAEEREAFLLYPARAWPHKNHTRLFEAFALLRQHSPELRLILTGGGLERLGALPVGVERWGIVPPTELASLYRRAACLVFPSLYEGFGLPPLEAMACGCPVAASRATAIPEAVGDAAALFDPEDAEDIAAVVGALLENPEPWATAGLEHAARFTWTKAATRHEAVYRSIL